MARAPLGRKGIRRWPYELPVGEACPSVAWCASDRSNRRPMTPSFGPGPKIHQEEPREGR